MFATERVRLRPPTPDDAPAMFRLDSDPELHLVTDDEPFLPQHVGQVRARLEKRAGEQPDVRSSVSLLAETVADGTFLGVGTLWGINAFNGLAHLGITLVPEARGQGYGTEVIQLLCRYGFRNRNLRRLEIETLAGNTAMRRTAERCGFVHEGTQRERGYDGDGFADMAIYGLLRRDWTR
ncbi:MULTISPECIES: GNAT family N-acetyltransferase [unclassified Micromonospora]|uniref:GNAT family N-acetyltransferase n=1 Tax=unclassified Micromonospora TaxID=2617518 RepID=UPI001B389B80|nr:MULTISPECIES: GNAT family protein [unclassified Micromonospora]MBQ1045614.1 GNAT family N-acetyltransferase [Micromonospora sp. C72]MBQ1055723.1 GNAT family N-acetyltransferase [Micromonospora sp. C32]